MPRRMILFSLCMLLAASSAWGTGTPAPMELTPIEEDPGLVGDVDGTGPVPAKALQDTVWIADWSFDSPSGCTSVGWTVYDLRIKNDGSNYWIVNNSLSGQGGVVGNAVMLRGHDVCWVRDGYPNDSDYSVVLKYRGATASVSFTYLSDTEPTYDYVTIEADSGGASESRVNYGVNPKLEPEDFRTELARFDDINTATLSFSVGLATLPIFGQPGVTHELYIRVVADGAASDEDGLYPSMWNAPLVVDNIVVTGDLAYSEDFADLPIDPNVSLINSAPATPFGIFARLFSHVTDNDKCTEDPTCAWIETDPLRIAFFPNMAFGPGSGVIRNWLDEMFVSPWVSLASTPSASGTVLSFRRFPGNLFSQGRIVQGWRVRAKLRTANTDTTVPGDSIDCLSEWGHSQQFNSLDPFVWVTTIFDMTTNFSPLGREIQVSFRTTDWQYLTGIGLVTVNPGPGPYTDRVRIGRRILTGPVFNIGIDTRTQAQDCFPTVQNGITPGQHFSPAPTDIFGTCAFSQGTELGIGSPGSANLITGDSIKIDNIVDTRGAGGVNFLKWYGAITEGPHAGKAPAPYTVGGSGFFEVQPDSCRLAGNGRALQGQWFVDLDDTYFRGGDALKYFWYAGDAQGGRASAPLGIGVSLPANVNAAEAATGGLFEVNFLPTIDWDPAYLGRIAADAHGDLDPTLGELANSTQRNCILYYQHTTSNRRSGPRNRTAFMYTLDRLGYSGYYDVYDIQGYGNTNNQLGGRANVAQCSRYSLIIEDDQRSNLVPNIPDGNPNNTDAEKINQALWYRNYLAQGASGLAGVANLWIIGETTAFEKSTNPLFTADMGLSSLVTDQGISVNPNVTGLGSFTFTGGGVANFAGDVFALNGGCPSVRNYDGATNAGTAVMTHRYTVGSANGPGAVIMNKNAVAGWNTIWMGFGWFDIRDAFNTPPNSGNGTPDVRLMRKILTAALPVNCLRGESPTGLPDQDELDAPRVTTLHQNVPNPFNPTTTIQFDLARDGQVKLQVFDVAGHLVRTLANHKIAKGFNQAVTWNGLDEKGLRVPSGVYFYQLVTEDYTATKKMVMLK